MKLIVIKNNLSDGLLSVARATGESQNLPILKNILIDATGSQIRLIATNLEIAVTTIVPGKIIEPGKATVPAAILSEIVANIKTDRINLNEQKQQLEIHTDNYEANIQTLPADDFPLIPKIKNNKTKLSIPSDVFKEALSQVVICAQPTELRPELATILFSYTVDQLTLVATDSFRLGQKIITKQNLSGNANESFSTLVPLKTAHELLRIIKTGGTTTIYRDENQIMFATEQTECISRLVEGTFPEYTGLVPKTFHAEVIVSREELLSALKLTSVFSTKTAEVKIKIPANQKNIEVFSTDQSIGENHYHLPAKTTGGLSEIGFNWRYLTDGLKAISGDQVLFGLNDENKPAIIKSPTDQGYFYILMPILRV